MTVRTGLIGAGRMGSILAGHLARVAGADFVALSDADGQRAAEMARRFQVPQVFADYREMLRRDDLDAVVIATPTNTHTEVITAAAEAGKHIFTEKPLALTVDRCKEALAAVEAAGVKMQVGFMRRFDPAYVAAKRKINEGAIGTPIMFKAVGRDSWRPDPAFARRENSGGLLLDMGIHDFDAARWLMSSEVERVYTEGECLVYNELSSVGDIDNAVVNLRFASGAVGNVDVSRNAVYGYDIRTEVVGSEGSIMIGDLRQTPTLILTAGGASHDTFPGFMERFADAYATEIEAFIQAVQEDHQVAVTGADAQAATAIGVAATRSLDEGRAVSLRELGQ